MTMSSPGRLPSIRVQSTLLFGLMALLLTTLLLGSAAVVMVRQVRQDQSDRLAATARSVAQALADGVKERSRQVNRIANDDALWAHGLDNPEARSALARLRDTEAATAWIGAADREGVVRNATDRILEGESVSQRPWFIAGLHEPFQGDVHEAVLLASRLPRPRNGEPLRFVDFAAPILHDGHQLGVLGLHGNWAWATTLVDRVLPEPGKRDGVEVLILDRENRVLFPATGDHAPWSPATSTASAPDGEATISALAAGLTVKLQVFPPDAGRSLGWQVVVQQPAAQAYRLPREALTNLAGLGLAAVLLAMLGTWLLSGAISRPLAHLAHVAQDFDPGKPMPAFELGWGNREVSTLARALFNTARRLVSSNQALERNMFEQFSALRAANDRLEMLNANQNVLLDNHLVGIARVQGLRMVWTNDTLVRMFGHGETPLAGQPLQKLFADEQAFLPVYRQASAQLVANGTYRTQVMMQHLDGHPLCIDLTATRLAGTSGESIWMLLDITAQKAREKAADTLALTDGLTGLSNRILLLDRLRQALAGAQRRDQHVCVCFIDLDGFKAINDLRGHAAGDEVLCAISARLTGQMRQTDTVARLGGDEFVVLLTGLADDTEYEPIVERLLRHVAAPVQLADGTWAQVSASIGLAMSPQHGQTPEALLRRADEAMYVAKRAGKNRFAMFEPDGLGNRSTRPPAVKSELLPD